jgi:hypothetical protein
MSLRVRDVVTDAKTELAAAISQGPALLVGVTGLVGLVMVFVGWRLARWARRDTGTRSLVAVAGAAAVATFLLILTGLAFRHYGGHTSTGAYRCDAWWAQIGSPHGVADGDGQSWPWCKRVAESAVASGVTEASIGSVLAGVVGAGMVQLRRRRLNSRLQGLTSASDSPG